MEATIEINEYTTEPFRIEQQKSWWTGATKEIRIPQTVKTTYTVYLTLVPSEEERAIILKYKLDDLVVESKPKFSEEYFAQREEHYRAQGLTDEHLNRGIRQGWDELRQMKDETTLGHYFDNPHTRSFDVRQDAHTYADKLETEILPLIKNQIDYYRLESLRRDKRTITL